MTARNRTAARRKAVLLAGTALCALSVADAARAQSFWSGGAGDWFDPGNWTAGVPDAGDTAIVNNGGTAEIGAPGAVSGIGSAGETAGNSGTVEVDGAGSTWTIGNTLYIGNSGTGTLDVTDGGAVSNHNGAIGTTATGSGTATVDGAGSTWTNSGQLTIGGAGTGALTVSGGGAASDNVAIVGESADGEGSVTVTGAGSTWTNTNNIAVGYNGDGTLSVEAGGAVSNTFATIGYFATGTGEATVDGEDSTWTNSSSLIAGYSGSGTLGITGGGTVSNVDGYLGYFAGSTGGATVDGAGSAWTNSSILIVGRAGEGTLEISGGGAVSNTEGYIGSDVGSTGEVTVTGADSIWTNSSFLRLGNSGAGTLNVENGGTVSNTNGFVGYSAGTTGTAIVTGANSTWTNSNAFSVGAYGNGILTVSNGGAVSNTVAANVGSSAGSTGLATITGANSTWTNTGTFAVGDHGEGTLDILDGGSVSNTTGHIGRIAGSIGAVTVDGADSAWTNSSELYIGNSGTGTLDITGGGVVSNTNGYIANQANSAGDVAVDGAGSEWNMSGNLAVGNSGDATLAISGGGAVSNVDALVGYFAAGSSEVTVDGADSTWTNTGDLYTGVWGGGTLDITGGGAVSSAIGYIGFHATGDGEVAVSGADSIWTNSDWLHVGHSGTGELTVENGGAVENVIGLIGSAADSTGTVTVRDAGSIWTSTNNMAVGYFGDGTLAVEAGGSVGNVQGFVGDQSTATGTATVTGAGSTWTNSGLFAVGNFGGGTLDILDGGAVSNTTGHIGRIAGSTGAVMVDGADSTWTNSSFLLVGEAGEGTLEIAGGGTVSNTDGRVGSSATGTGEVTVSGAGSLWTNTATLIVGSSGNGTLDIEDGGEVTNTGGYVGYAAGSTGEIAVDGTGSTWINSLFLYVGDSGDGTLGISDGGTVEVGGGAGTVRIADQAGSTGTLNIGAASGDAAVAAGTLDAASVVFGAGTGTLVFNHTGSNHLAADVSGAGTVRIESGRTVLTGTNTYAGGTTIAGGLLIGDSASLAGDIEMAAPAAQLYFNQSTDGSFAGAVGGGSGYVAKTGAGVLLFEDTDIDVNFFHASGGGTVFDGGAIAVETLYSGFLSDAGHAAEAAGLMIGGGAQVTSDHGSLGGDDADFGTTVEVSGAGTKWSIGTELAPTTFYIRGRGDADLRIENGGVVEVFGDVVISSVEPGKTAALTVDGAGSAFLSSTDIDLGSIVDGDGRIAVSNGGVVRVAGGAGVIMVAQHEDSASVEVNIGAAQGAAAIGAGTLDVASVDFGGVDGGDGSLIFNHTALDYIFAPVVSGFGTIMQLAGVTRLTGDNFAFEGTAQISGGTLVVDGALGGHIQVSGSGRLGGSGNLENVTIGNGGIFAPGNSVGSMIASGDFIFAAGSVYEVEVNDGTGLPFIDRPGVNNDYIDVYGSLTIDGGASVSVTPENGTDDGTTYTPGLVYTILSATGGVTGAFGAVTASFAFLTPELSYDANNVFLELLQNDVDFVDVAETPNQQGVSNTVQTFGPGHPLYDEIILMTEEEARAAYDALSGEAHASSATAQFMTAGEIRQQLLDRLAAILGSGGGGFAGLAGAPAAGDAAPGAVSVWGQLFGGWGRTDDNRNAATIARDVYGFIGGIDREVAPGVRAGIAAGYSRSTYDVAARSSSGDSDNFHIAGYAGTALGAFDLKGVASYGYGRVDTRRTVIVGLLTNTLSADYATHTFQAGVEAGLDLDFGPLVLTPFAGLAGVHVETEGFTETGGPAALTVGSTSNTVGVSTLGLRARRQAGSVGVTGALAWRHAFGDVAPVSRAAFASAPAASFAVRGAPISENALALDAAVDAKLGADTTLTFGYSGQYASGARDHGARAELRIEF